MVYRRSARPTFNASAVFVATNRLSVYNGVPMVAGDKLPPLPKDTVARIKYTRDLRQLYEMRRIEYAVADKGKPLTKKEKT